MEVQQRWPKLPPSASVLTLESCQHLTTSQQGLSVLNTGKLWHTQVTTMGQKSDLQFPDTAVHAHRVGHQGNSFIV